MYAGAVDRAAEELLERNQPMPVVEIQAAEYFVRSVAKLRHEKGARRFGSRQCRSETQRFTKMSPRELESRLENRVARGPDSRLREAPGRVRGQQVAQ